MTTLYRPVLIESVEQAEALPDGTVAICKNHYAREKVGPVSWIAPWGTVRRRDAMVGWTALVPIEAEEETVEKRKLCQASPDVLHRYVTGWQHYTAEEQNR